MDVNTSMISYENLLFDQWIVSKSADQIVFGRKPLISLSYIKELTSGNISITRVVHFMVWSHIPFKKF